MVIGKQSAEALVGTKGPFKAFSSPQGSVVSSVPRGQGGQFCLCPKGHREVKLQVPLAGDGACSSPTRTSSSRKPALPSHALEL